jgi:hypothetical protein
MPAVDLSTGQLHGGANDYHKDDPINGVQGSRKNDSGTYYREHDWSEYVRQAESASGPTQLGLVEVLSVDERTEDLQRRLQQERQQPSQGQASRVGSRVNPNNKEREYSMEGYERSSYIDPARSIAKPLPRAQGQGGAKQVKPETRPASVLSDVLFETAAVGAKIRNTNRMGGERVKVMDHFVASVETPTVVVQPPDVADMVNERGRQKQTVEVPLRVQHADVPLFVQTRFVESGGQATCKLVIRQHAHLLWRLLHTVFVQLLQVPHEIQRVRLLYMSTLRANSSVAVAAKDGFLYFNVLVLQQMQCCDTSRHTAAGGNGGGEDSLNLSASLSAREMERAWLYWLQRAAMILPRPDGERVTGAWAGLYDPGVRYRFDAFAATSFKPDHF